MGIERAGDWLWLLPLAWIGSSVSFCIARWQSFGSIRHGALYYEPMAQVSQRGLPLKLIGLSAEVAIDPELLKIRMGFPQSVVFFFGYTHREIVIRREQIKSARLKTSTLGIAPDVEITYEDDLGHTTTTLRVKDPNQVLVMLSNVGERI